LNPEAEQLFRLEQLRRRINAEARASVLWLVAALVVAFALGYLAGRLWR
jgi:hypothetical protein